MFQLLGRLVLVIIVIPILFVVSTVMLIFEGMHRAPKRKR